MSCPDFGDGSFTSYAIDFFRWWDFHGGMGFGLLSELLVIHIQEFLEQLVRPDVSLPRLR